MSDAAAVTRHGAEVLLKDYAGIVDWRRKFGERNSAGTTWHPLEPDPNG